tara:strand:- start:224 stop:1096 length:873 start_codon:yes stop_codon:yes gene_type:complete
VPLAYGPKQKFLARLDQQKDIDDPKIALKLPRMSFELTSLTYNPNTKLQKGIKQSFPDPLDNNKMKTVLGPVGYSLGVSLNIMAKNQDDALQILEQILPFFQPDYTVSIKEVDNTFRSDQPFVLQSVSLADDYEGDFATRRVIIYTLDFETKVNFYGGIGSQGLIKTVNIDYNNVISASTKPLERQDVNVNPLSAAETDAHTIVETIFQPNDPDRVILTIGAIGGSASAFTVGETISANNSGATAVVVSVKNSKLTAKSVNGIFNTTDTISGGTSASTTTISVIEELWND